MLIKRTILVFDQAGFAHGTQFRDFKLIAYVLVNAKSERVQK